MFAMCSIGLESVPRSSPIDIPHRRMDTGSSATYHEPTGLKQSQRTRRTSRAADTTDPCLLYKNNVNNTEG